jgi:hypothetical protein
MADEGGIDQQALAGRFVALVEGVRRHGLTDDVAALETWIDQASDPGLQGEMAKLLGFFWLRRGNLEKAVRWSDLARQHLPQDHAAAYNAIFACFQSGRWEETVARAKAALETCGEHFEFCNILSTALGALGRLDEARGYGTHALALKSRMAAAPPRDLSAVPVPAFDATAPGRNIISFSLFGALPLYTEGAVLNARAAAFLYPGWTCRFYVDDSVPRPVTRALAQAGAQVMTVGGLPREPYGTLWRFLVADDASVDRFVLRDADSLLNTRERVAVDEWLASGRHFHVMRDHYDHSELVLAGMWGGVRGALPPMVPAIRAWFASPRQVLGRTADQEFLREVLWPTIAQSVLTHDSQFAFAEARDFPALGRLPPGQWVGCRWERMRRPPPVGV